MGASTRISSSTPRRRYTSHVRKTPSTAYERDSDNSTASLPKAVGRLVTDELRRVRTDSGTKRPEYRRREAERAMVSDTHRRNHSSSRVSSMKESRTSVHEVREKHISEHRHRRRKPKEEEGDDGGSVVYVYKSKRDEKERGPQRLRRTTESITGRRTGYGRDRVDGTDISRRSTRRQSSYPPEREKATLPPEKRYVTETITKARNRQSVGKCASLRETASTPLSRPSLARSKATTRKVRQPSASLATSPSTRQNMERAPSGSRTNDRSSGVFSIFRSSRPIAPEKQIECLTCLSSDIPISKSAKLSCDHRMCHACLQRIFTLSVTDPQHMPPKCCTQDHIPLKHVEKLFDLKFKMKWNQKYQEYTTKNRIYCPARGCGKWIKPANIRIDTSGGANGGRKYGKCARCRTKVCCTCNGKWHTSRECPKDEATQRFAEIAKKEGWQRCFNCSATVELKEGCNHMTCRCRAEFCMICGLKWKTCDCPWFTYEAVENDRLNHMNIPQVRRVPVNAARGYHEEINQRREQERRDEAMARRFQILGLDGGGGMGNIHDHDPHDHHTPHGPNNFAHGNAGHHILNQDFARRAADILSGTYNPAQAATAIRIMDELRPPPPQPPAPQQRQQPQLNHLLRHHSTASRQYNNHAQTRPSERVVPRRVETDYETEVLWHRPQDEHGIADGGLNTEDGETRGHPPRKHSALAGLTRGTAEGRVDEWRRHIGDD